MQQLTAVAVAMVPSNFGNLVVGTIRERSRQVCVVGVDEQREPPPMTETNVSGPLITVGKTCESRETDGRSDGGGGCSGAAINGCADAGDDGG